MATLFREESLLEEQNGESENHRSYSEPTEFWRKNALLIADWRARMAFHMLQFWLETLTLLIRFPKVLWHFATNVGKYGYGSEPWCPSVPIKKANVHRCLYPPQICYHSVGSELSSHRITKCLTHLTGFNPHQAFEPPEPPSFLKFPCASGGGSRVMHSIKTWPWWDDADGMGVGAQGGVPQ